MSRKPQQKGQATPADRTAGGGADPPAPRPRPDISDRGKIITKGLTEQNFSDSSGIPRSRLKIFRKEFLDEGADLSLENGYVTFTAAGQDKLTAKLELGQEVKAPEEEKTTLVIERFWTNPTLLGCRQEGSHEEGLETVRVRDAKNFIKGMKVPVKRQPGQRLWLLDGPHPRYRGRY